MPESRDKSIKSRVKLIRECTEVAKRLKARRIVGEASRRRRIPDMANIRELEKLVPGDEVLVYREDDGWKSFPFVRMEPDGIVVKLPHKESKFIQ